MSKKKFTLTWTSCEYTLKEFVEIYKSRLPLVVRVNQGYCGYGEDKFTYSTEDVHRITHIKSQKRVIAKDQVGRLLSIPVDYPIKFHPVEKRKQLKSQRLEVFLQRQLFYPGMKVIPESGSRLTFWVGADNTMKTEMGTLELIATFDDQFMVGNLIIAGTIYHRSIYIPMFVPIKLVLANGIKKGTAEEFQRILTQYDICSRNFNNDAAKGNPEIMLFDIDEFKLTSDTSEYVYLKPKGYISCAQEVNMRSSFKDGKAQKDDEYVTPVDRTDGMQRRSVWSRNNKPLPPLPDESAFIHPSIAPHNLKKHGEMHGFQFTKLDKSATHNAHIVKELRSRNSQIKGALTLNCKYPENPETMTVPEFPEDIQPYLTYEDIKHNVASPTQIDNTNKKVYFSNINSVPLSLEGVSKRGITDCLKLLHLEEFTSTFVDNDIDGDLLISLDKQTFMEDLRMSRLQAQKLYKFIHGWRPKE